MPASISFHTSSESSAAGLTLEQAVLSAYHHQSNGQVKACIKLIKHALKNVPTPVGMFTWHYYKSVLAHWGKACQA